MTDVEIGIVDDQKSERPIKIKGGVYQMVEKRKFKCFECDNVWEIVYGAARPEECPKCQSKSIGRAEEDGECARGRAWRHGRRRCRRAKV